MKRLLLIMGLILVLALAACNAGQPEAEVLPEDGTLAAVTVEAVPEEQATQSTEPVPPADGAGAQVIPALAGTAWEWVDLTTPVETITAVDPARYVIQFNDDGTAFITADCNSVSGTYVTDETGAIAITLGASTMVACPEDTQDQLFLGALGGASNYFALETGADLFIDQIADAGTMRLRPAAGTTEGEATGGGELTGVTWEWVSTVDATGQTVAADPTRYTIVFNEDATANVQADCNTAVAQYILDGSNLNIATGAITLMACPEGSQDQVFLAHLSNASAYSVEDSELFIEQETGGTMMFRQAGTSAGMGEAGGTGEAAAPSLTDTRWEWVSTTTATETITAADPARYAITFAADGSAGIVADCNVGNATYTTGDGNTLSVVLGVSTMAFCTDSQDQQFRTGLEAAASYAFEGSDLVVTQTDGGTMRFRAGADDTTGETGAAEQTLVGETWQWVATVTPAETITANDPTRYTITFMEDGTASIKADCNMVTATYTTADATLALTMGASTLAMCPEDSQATPFLAGLSAAATYFFQDGHLFIDQFASAGTLEFTPSMIAAGETGSKGETSPAAGGLVGTTWQWTSLNSPNATTTVNDPSRFTITFNADGTANLQADCNVVMATYTTGEGNVLGVVPGASTMAACQGMLDQVFVGGLTNAAGYRLEGGQLLIDMLYESGTLVFSAAP